MQATTATERIAGLAYDYGAQPKEWVRDCNLCGAVGCAVEVARHDRYGYPATLVVCQGCGLGYLCPRMTPTAYGHFYSLVYRPLVSAFHGRRIDAETVQGEQRTYATDLATFVAPPIGVGPRTILDVGGSTGVVAGVLAKRFDAQAMILDPAADELAVAHAGGMETVAGFAEDFDAAGRSWGLVLLCQTIDHLLDVRATLEAMRAMTAVGGRAFVDILDVDLIVRRVGSIEGAAKIDHPYYLTRATAQAFFAVAGFDIVAERLTDDGHRGFMLVPGRPTVPDWPALRAAAAEWPAEVRTHRERPLS